MAIWAPEGCSCNLHVPMHSGVRSHLPRFLLHRMQAKRSGGVFAKMVQRIEKQIMVGPIIWPTGGGASLHAACMRGGKCSSLPTMLASQEDEDDDSSDEEESDADEGEEEESEEESELEGEGEEAEDEDKVEGEEEESESGSDSHGGESDEEDEVVPSQRKVRLLGSCLRSLHLQPYIPQHPRPLHLQKARQPYNPLTLDPQTPLCRWHRSGWSITTTTSLMTTLSSPPSATGSSGPWRAASG
jgi:hypothetical protein